MVECYRCGAVLRDELMIVEGAYFCLGCYAAGLDDESDLDGLELERDVQRGVRPFYAQYAHERRG